MTSMDTNEPRKSIFPNNYHNAIEIDKAIKHNIGNGTFGFSEFFEKLKEQGLLTEEEFETKKKQILNM